eukprot:g3623.t1
MGQLCGSTRVLTLQVAEQNIINDSVIQMELERTAKEPVPSGSGIIPVLAKNKNIETTAAENSDTNRTVSRFRDFNPKGASAFLRLPLDFNGCVLNTTSANCQIVNMELFSGHSDCVFFGIFEGFGRDGRGICEYVSESLPNSICNIWTTTTVLKKAMETGTNSVRQALLASEDFDLKNSGCVCTFVVLEGQLNNSEKSLLTVGQLGNTTVTLALRNQAKESEPIPKQIQFDHSWHFDQVEKVPDTCELRQMVDASGTSIAPLRLYMKGKKLPGISVTHCLGSTMGNYFGVSSEVQIKRMYIKLNDFKFLLLATWAVWEVFQQDEAMAYIDNLMKGTRLDGQSSEHGVMYKSISRKFVEECEARWMKKVESGEKSMVHECGALVVEFHKGAALTSSNVSSTSNDSSSGRPKPVKFGNHRNSIDLSHKRLPKLTSPNKDNEKKESRLSTHRDSLQIARKSVPQSDIVFEERNSSNTKEKGGGFGNIKHKDSVMITRARLEKHRAEHPKSVADNGKFRPGENDELDEPPSKPKLMHKDSIMVNRKRLKNKHHKTENIENATFTVGKQEQTQEPLNKKGENDNSSDEECLVATPPFRHRDSVVIARKKKTQKNNNRSSESGEDTFRVQ